MNKFCGAVVKRAQDDKLGANDSMQSRYSPSRMQRWVAPIAIAATVVGLGSGCTAVVQGSALSSRPAAGNQVYLSTGAAQRPYVTLGFVQATGFGNQVAGVVDIGDAQIDGTIKGALVDAAIRMGGDGVINIEFLDENPQTPAERARDLADSLSVDRQGKREIKTRWRSVHATGEVIRFQP